VRVTRIAAGFLDRLRRSLALTANLSQRERELWDGLLVKSLFFAISRDDSEGPTGPIAPTSPIISGLLVTFVIWDIIPETWSWTVTENMRTALAPKNARER